MILSLKGKKKGSETPVISGDCLGASDLNADFFPLESRFRFGYLTNIGIQGNPRFPMIFLWTSPLIVQACVRACFLA